MKTTIQVHILIAKKLKEVSDQRKKDGRLPNKQTEILTELINGIHKKEIK